MTGRSYEEACGIARGLDAVGERWALLVVRELLLGPKRFTDLQRDLPGPSPNVLSQRLRDLEAAGVVRRTTLPRPASAPAYELTEWGSELAPALAAFGRWGSRSPAPIVPAMSLDAMVLAMNTTFQAERARGVEGEFALELEGEAYSLNVRDGGLQISRGRPAQAAGALRTDRAGLAELLWGDADPTSLARSGRAEVEGDEVLLAQLFDGFPAPPRSERPSRS